MNFDIPHSLRRGVAWAGLLCGLFAGCAGLPRIDPSGNRLLVWPKDQVRTQQLAASPFALPPGNVNAPPVVTDPVFPPQPASTVAVPSFTAGNVTPVSAISTNVLQGPTDKLNVTPGRILAPVGSEVVLKASICAEEGYTLADQKIEWMLGRNGVGEFVETGGKGLFHPPLLRLFRGKKVDNYLAHGYTANGPLCIDRGTADPSDDVNINRGDAWITVTAAHEGTSWVTAVAPRVDSWNERRGFATIYWIDAQWLFPPSTIDGGSGQTLTTTVTRQSDGTPVEGYLVRYEVADGGSLGGAAAGSSQVAEVRTGVDGKATVEVAPTASGAGSSQINTQLIRPAGANGGESPRLVIANSSTLVRWNSGAQPYLPPNASTIPVTPTPIPAPTLPPIGTTPVNPAVPAMPAGAPQLEVAIRGPQQADVGGEVRFEVDVTNSGNAPATQVVLNDQFQRGLSHLSDSAGYQQIEKPLGTIMPGQTTTTPMTFGVNAAGELCHDVTVTCAEKVAPALKRGCVTAVQAAATLQPGIKVDKTGPQYAVVGDPVRFTVSVKNTGETDLVNVELVDEYPPSFLRVMPTDQSIQIVGGTIRRVIDRLPRGAARQFVVDCTALSPIQDLSIIAKASAESDPPAGRISNTDDSPLEIRARRDGAGAPGVGGAATGGDLQVSGRFSAVVGSGGRATVRSGTRTSYEVTLKNIGAALDQNVALRVQFPTQLTPDLNANGISGPPGVTFAMQNGWLVFSPLQTLRSQEEVTYVIPATVGQTGVVEVVSQAMSQRVPQAKERRDSLEILGL